MRAVCILSSFIAIILCSCWFMDDLVIQADKKTFDKERAAWDNQNLKNYQFTYKYSDGATGPGSPVKVTVKENEEPVIENQRENYGYFFKSISEIYNHVNGTFDYVESVKNGTYDGHKIRSVTLDITYNKQYHYPTKVDLSTGYVEQIAGGAYYNLEITEFVPIQ